MSVYIPHYFSDAWLCDFSRRFRDGASVTPNARFRVNYRWRRILMFRLRQDDSLDKLAYFGSMVRGTNIVGFSDTDVLAVVSQPVDSDPTKSFEIVKTALGDALDGILDLHTDHPAVRIIDPFDGVAIDFIPAYRVLKGVYAFYDLGTERWVETIPSRQNRYILDARRFSGHAVELIRLVKIWNYYADSKISSIYLELFVAQFVRIRRFDSVLDALINILKELLRQNLPPIADPSAESNQMILPGSEGLAIDRVRFLLRHSIECGFAADAAERSQDLEQCAMYMRWMFPKYANCEDELDVVGDMLGVELFVSRFSHDPRYADYLSDYRRKRTILQRRVQRKFRP